MLSTVTPTTLPLLYWTILNYHWTFGLDVIRWCKVVIHNQTSNEQEQLEPS